MLLPVSALCEDGLAMGGSEVKEPEVRWTYGVSLTALQSPYLMLVNEQNPLDKTFEPSPLVKMTSVKRATSATIYLQEACAKAIEEMFAAALDVQEYTYTTVNSKGEETEHTASYPKRHGAHAQERLPQVRHAGHHLSELSGPQQRRRRRLCQQARRQRAPERPVLRHPQPGLRHPGNMTQDFKYTPEAQWMKENCAQFGLILRYTEDGEAATGIKFEPWHFRYVGREAAGYISSTGMSLEAFTEEWQAALADFEARGGDVKAQLAYEESTKNAPPASYVLDETGEDGDAEISLVF